ncbi:MAG: hypothetical protein AAF902_01965 [Chloroflexota bacterium]
MKQDYLDLPLLAFAEGDMSQVIDQQNGYCHLESGQIKGRLGSSWNNHVIVSCGLGVNSIALLHLLHAYRIRPDEIVFSELRDEKPITYEVLVNQLNPWHKSIGFPKVTLTYSPLL